MSRTVKDCELVTIDPNDSVVLDWDWDARNLADGVQLASSTFALTAVRQSGSPTVTVDNDAMLTAAQATAALGRTVTLDNRVTQIRVIGGGDVSLGDLFELANAVTTNETPAQIKERSIRILVEQK